MTDQSAGVSKAQASGEAARPPLPPFTRESAIQKVRLAEDGVEFPRPGEGGAVVHGGLALEKSGGIYKRQARNHLVSQT